MYIPEEIVKVPGRRIGIGEMAVGGPTDRFRVTLGSCVGVCIFHNPTSRFAVAHVLLPSTDDGACPRNPARFATTAVPALIEALGEIERRRDVVAYVAGGGNMYTGEGVKAAVGGSNAKRTLEALAKHRVRVAHSDFGGTAPRQMIIDGPSREVLSLVMTEEPHSTTWEFPARFGLEEAA